MSEPRNAESPLLMSALLGEFVPTRLHMRLSGTIDDYTPKDDQGEQTEAEATLVHESIHFFQTIFTGFGHLAWQMHRQATNQLVRLWHQLATANGSARRLPLGHLASGAPPQVAAQIAFHADAARAATGLMQARHSMKSPDAVLSDLGLIHPLSPWRVNPQIQLHGEPYVLQGVDILENQALHLEGLYSAMVGGIPYEESWKFEEFPHRYSSAFAWFITELSPSRLLEFSIICDLALQITFSDPPKTEAGWQASHPAWRFLALVEAAKTISPDLRPQRPEDVPMLYVPYTNALLTACGYVSIDSVLNERAKTLLSKTQRLPSENLMLEAIDFRRKYPWCLAHPFAEIQVWQQMKAAFRPPFFEVNGQLFAYADTEEAARYSKVRRSELAKESFMELQFQAFAAQLLGYNSRGAQREKQMECAFSLFDIPRGCPLQISDYCTGRFHPRDGTPFPSNVDGSGCAFDMFAKTAGIPLRELDFNPDKPLPTKADLDALEKQLRDRSGDS